MDFDQIYEQYFNDVFLYLRSLSATADMAEELAQETFTKVLKSIDHFDDSKDIRPWLFTIAKNTYYTYCRRQKIYVDADFDDTTANVPDTSKPTVEILVDKESAFLIHQFLHTMKEPYKEVFNLRVFGELPFDKIGQLLEKVPVGRG